MLPNIADLLHENAALRRRRRRIRELVAEAQIAHTRGADHVVADRLESIMEQTR